MQKPQLTVMADRRDRWLWSFDIDRISLPGGIIGQAEGWLEKYTHFLTHPDDKFLQSQFNPEGLNIAAQVQGFLGSDMDVLYAPIYPERKHKRGEPEPIQRDSWYEDFSSQHYDVEVHTPLDGTAFIMEKCEEDGDVTEIEADYYQWFIALGDEEMRGLIRRLIFSMRKHINDLDQWKSDDELFDLLHTYLFMIMRGMMYFTEDGGEPVFAKPTHMPSDEEIQLLRIRADSEWKTIREVFWEILKEQAADKATE